MRTTKLVSISLAPELLKEVEEVAKQEHRTRSEFFREALRNYLEEKRTRQKREMALDGLYDDINMMRNAAKDVDPKIIEKEVEEAIHAYRKSKTLKKDAKNSPRRKPVR